VSTRGSFAAWLETTWSCWRRSSRRRGDPDPADVTDDLREVIVEVTDLLRHVDRMVNSTPWISGDGRQNAMDGAGESD
jgi:hypothetical protein